MAIRMVKEQATMHLTVTQDRQFFKVVSLSNILRYYSGVVSQHVACCS